MADNLNEIEQQEVEEFTAFTYSIVVNDSNNWDLMNGRELNKRLSYFAKRPEKENFIRVYSCLRLAEIYYLRKKEDKEWATLVSENPETEEKFLFVFSTPKHIPKDMLTECKLAKMGFRDFLETFKNEVTCIVLNCDTDCFNIPVKEAGEYFSMMDRMENTVDEMMEQGLSGDSLLDMIFDRFWGRKLYCKMKDGKEIEGECYSFDFDKNEMFLIVETENGDINIKQKDIEFIKSLPYDEE